MNPELEQVTFVDEASGFQMTYPSTWDRLDSEDSTIVLDLSAENLGSIRMEFAGLLDLSVEDRGSVRVEFRRTAKPTTTENVANLFPITDKLVELDPTAIVLKRVQITLDGMPGFYYLNRFTDQAGQEGASARYFLFRGYKMYVIVFRTVPAEEFAGLATTLDQVAGTIRTTPDDALLPEPLPSTTP